MFTQHINFGNSMGNQEFAKFCKEHPGCENCPLKTEDITVGGHLTRCLTGREKGNENGSN